MALMLTCREMAQIITDYLEGRMPFWQRLKFRMHVGMCRDCWAYVDQIRKTIAMTGQLPRELPDDAARDELLRRFRDWDGHAGSDGE